MSCSVIQAGVQWLLSRLTASSTSRGLSDSPASAPGVAGITGAHHHAQLIFVFLVETGFYYVGQAGLKLLTSGDLPASASQSAGITSVSHCARPGIHFLLLLPSKVNYHLSFMVYSLTQEISLLPHPLCYHFHSTLCFAS